MIRPLLAICLLGCLAGCGSRAPAPPAPRQIRLVGAAAALPFTGAAAEAVARALPRAVAPLVRAGGSGAGIARFCRGAGRRFPDLVATTRAPTPAELAACRAHGVGPVAAVPLGWTALVLATRPDTPLAGVSRAALWRALATPAASWETTDPRLPALAVLVDGASPRPAIADGLFDALLGPGCVAAGGSGCAAPHVRHDGGYRAHGADPDLAIAAALATPGAVAIVPWAQATARGDAVKLLALDGVAPTAATIADGRYPARLPLLLLVKPDAARVPALPALLRAVAAGIAPGGGYAALGLVPLAPAAAARSAAMLDALAAGRVSGGTAGGGS